MVSTANMFNPNSANGPLLRMESFFTSTKSVLNDIGRELKNIDATMRVWSAPGSFLRLQAQVMEGWKSIMASCEEFETAKAAFKAYEGAM